MVLSLNRNAVSFLCLRYLVYTFSFVFSKKAGGGGDGGDGDGFGDDDGDGAIMLWTLSPQIPALHYYMIMAKTSIMVWLFAKNQWFSWYV